VTTALDDPGAAAGGSDAASGLGGGFAVHLDVFEGPFDLLLSLIAKRRLDVTLVALSQVTDEFITYIRRAEQDWDLDQASEFLVIAATLLDLKIARLLPSAEAEDDEDLALLEARDLLFARLLQYRAYRQVADWLRDRWEANARVWPRSVTLEAAFTDRIPPTVLTATPADFAAMYARACRPRPLPVVDISHVHAPAVSVREQAVLLAARLRGSGSATFRALVADCHRTVEVVARFLAVLELYREGVVLFDQLEPLGELRVRWSGRDELPDGLDTDDYGPEERATAGVAGQA
jgi:segregation and condensation protein A